MKTIVGIGLALLLLPGRNAPAQLSWNRLNPARDGCPGCMSLAAAEPAPRLRGEPISTGKPVLPVTNSVAGVTNAPGPVELVSRDESIGFDKLAGFRLELSAEQEHTTNEAALVDAQINAMIPTNILALDGRRVAIEGFMSPVEFEKDRTIEFLLQRDPPACCYATMPNLHEWVVVSVKSPGVPARMYQVIRASGVLHVGVKRQNGMVSSLYRLEADKVVEVSR